MNMRNSTRTPPPAPTANTSRILRGSERFEFQTPLPISDDGPGTTTRIRRGVSGKVPVATPIVAAPPSGRQDGEELRMDCRHCRQAFVVPAQACGDRLICIHCGTVHRIGPVAPHSPTPSTR